MQQPAQYIGGEVNQLPKPGDWEAAEIRVAVAFPDTYAIGMSHLGCQILYWLCNHTPGVSGLRGGRRSDHQALLTWDTRQPVASADLFAISLQYELCFTTVLNLLDLAGIPVRAAERDSSRQPSGEEWPLVIVGGPQADNPEPMADFVDLVVIGDGEASMAAIVEAYREYKRAGVSRREMILLMARRFPWIYAPNLYDITYHEDGTIAGMLPNMGLPDLSSSKTPDFKLPFPAALVHGPKSSTTASRSDVCDCRRSAASATPATRSARSASASNASGNRHDLAGDIHEIGLLSLSTADYPHLRELADRINERFAPRMVNLSFPSLRIDKMLQNIPWMAYSVARGASIDGRQAADMIRKKVTDGNLLEGVREIYKAGWQRVKLYFMSGFPGERSEDIDGIFEVADAVSRQPPNSSAHRPT